MLTMTKKIQSKPESAWHKWGKLAVISLSLAIVLIDTTLLNVSLRNIIEDLNSNFTEIQWVITLYTLTLSAFTITGGRLGDLYGRKRMFILGAILFAGGSLVASMSHSMGMLLVGESIIEGIGAALMMPAAASLLLTNFEGKDRAIGFAVFGAVAGASSAIGPILGGWLTSNYSWRWGFRINIVVVILLLLGSVLIKDSRDTKEKAELDWAGVALSSSGLLLLVFGIIQSSDYGWWLAKANFAIGGVQLGWGGLSVTPFAIGLGLMLLGTFAWWQKYREDHGHTPLVSLSLFMNRQFISGALVTTALSLSMTGLIFIFPVYFQAVHGLDAFHTGLALFPLSLTVFIVSPLALIVAKKVRPKTMILSGLVITAIANLVMIVMLKPGAGANVLVPGFILFGIGMGLVFSQINNLTLSAVEPYQAGEASGLNNTLRQVGASFGAAIIGAALFASIASQISAHIRNDTVIPDVARTKITEQAEQASKTGEFSSGSKGSEIPPEIANQLSLLPPQARAAALDKYKQQQAVIATAVESDVHNGITDAVKDSLRISLAFAVLSILVGFAIPNIGSMMKDTDTAPNVGH